MPDAYSACAPHLRALADFSHSLQAASTLDESLQLIGEFLPRLFHAPGGAIYLIGKRSQPLRRACAWGRAPAQPARTVLAALRGGDGSGQKRRGAVWLPLRVNDQTEALLGLSCAGGDAEALLQSPYTASAVEQIALEIGNMMSRDALREQSIRDPLTGLYNRRYLEESLQRELLRAARRRGSRAGLAVLMIDVDLFKRFNDEHGHEAGDLVLAAMGSQLRRIVRASDIASRYGGEEFVVALPDVTPARAMVRAEQIRAAIESHRLEFHGATLPPVTVSIGVAMHPQHGDSVDALIRSADAALYEAKHAGRNQVRCASSVSSFERASPAGSEGLGSSGESGSSSSGS
jgi:diguanylate cyclase (GGDEF)-like protein